MERLKIYKVKHRNLVEPVLVVANSVPEALKKFHKQYDGVAPNYVDEVNVFSMKMS